MKKSSKKKLFVLRLITQLAQNAKLQRVLFATLIMVSLFRPLSITFQYRDSLFNRGFEKQFDHYKDLYYSSQYMEKVNPIIIPDEIFRSFQGGIFLRGLNPIMITSDHPPLGGYLIAGSIFLFDNPRTLIIFCLIVGGWGLCLISKKTIGNPIFAFIPVGLFISEPIFTNKLIYAPLIGPIQFPFLVFAFYFFLRALESKKYTKWFVLTSLFLGCVISTRFFITGGVMCFCMVMYLLVTERRISKKFIIFLVTLPISLIVLVLSYTRTMMDGYSIIQVLKIQKYILMYHKSKYILPFSFWSLLLFNKWYTWWGEWTVVSDPQWLITWPISVFLTSGNLIFGIFRKVKLNRAEKVLTFWLICYSIALSSGFSSTNYFLPFLPFFYILGASFLYKIFRYILIRYEYSN